MWELCFLEGNECGCACHKLPGDSARSETSLTVAGDEGRKESSTHGVHGSGPPTSKGAWGKGPGGKRQRALVAHRQVPDKRSHNLGVLGAEAEEPQL